MVLVSKTAAARAHPAAAAEQTKARAEPVDASLVFFGKN